MRNKALDWFVRSRCLLSYNHPKQSVSVSCHLSRVWVYFKGGWKRRWTVLRDSQLFFYETQKAQASGEHALSIVDLDAWVTVKRISATDRVCFQVVCPHRVYSLQASSPDEMEAWYKTLKRLLMQKSKLLGRTTGMHLQTIMFFFYTMVQTITT